MRVKILNYKGESSRSSSFNYKNKRLSLIVFDKNSINFKILDESRVNEISTS